MVTSVECEWSEQDGLTVGQAKSLGNGQSGETYLKYEHCEVALLLYNVLSTTKASWHITKGRFFIIICNIFILIISLLIIHNNIFIICNSLYYYTDDNNKEAESCCVATSPGTHTAPNNDLSSNASRGRGASTAAEGVRGKGAGRQYQAAQICTNNLAAVPTSH